MNKKIWLSVDVLFKNTVWYSSGSNLHSLDTQQRAYDIWNRANDLVKKNDSPFDLTDGITNLKRSINHRLKLIEEIYHLKKNRFPRKTQRLFGAIRKLFYCTSLFNENSYGD